MRPLAAKQGGAPKAQGRPALAVLMCLKRPSKRLENAVRIPIHAHINQLPSESTSKSPEGQRAAQHTQHGGAGSFLSHVSQHAYAGRAARAYGKRPRPKCCQ